MAHNFQDLCDASKDAVQFMVLFEKLFFFFSNNMFLNSHSNFSWLMFGN